MIETEIKENVMRGLTSWLGAGMGMLLFLAGDAYAGEKLVLGAIPADKVPKPVMQSVKARFSDAKVLRTARELDDDKNIIYELALKVNGQAINVLVAPKGNIQVIEKAITFEALPEPVAKTFHTKYPKATYQHVEEVFKVEEKNEKLVSYEAVLTTAGKRELAVEVTPQGKIVKEETDQ